MFKFWLDLFSQGVLGKDFVLLPTAQVWIALGFGLGPVAA